VSVRTLVPGAMESKSRTLKPEDTDARMTTLRMMCRDEETRRRPGSHAGPSNDGVMRTYETSGLVMLGAPD
jgi:hypothetical protein